MRIRLAPISLMLVLAGCASTPALLPEPLARADAAVDKFIEARQMPGGVLWIGHGQASYRKAYGEMAPGSGQPVQMQTVFDAASLTKPVVTATLVQILRERGLLDMDASAQRYIPECSALEGVTMRELLTHTSGLRPDLPRSDEFFAGAEPRSVRMPQAQRDAQIADAVRRACALPREDEPGTRFRYSDLNFILLAEIISRVSGEPLQRLAQRELFEPLGMNHSGYLPLDRGVPAETIAPTNKPTEVWERGAVHDPTARRMGGVAGHAGLFTTAGDLARFARMLLRDGVMDSGRRLLSHESIVLLLTPQTPPDMADQRSVGWDVDTAFSRPRGRLFPKGRSFGHTGFTGCALWLDPGSRSFFILLANRVSMPGASNTLPLYGELGTLAAEAAGLKP